MGSPGHQQGRAQSWPVRHSVHTCPRFWRMCLRPAHPQPAPRPPQTPRGAQQMQCFKLLHPLCTNHRHQRPQQQARQQGTSVGMFRRSCVTGVHWEEVVALCTLLRTVGCRLYVFRLSYSSCAYCCILASNSWLISSSMDLGLSAWVSPQVFGFTRCCLRAARAWMVKISVGIHAGQASQTSAHL